MVLRVVGRGDGTWLATKKEISSDSKVAINPAGPLCRWWNLLVDLVVAAAFQGGGNTERNKTN
jgi:hypothetical protein